jgi:hypothetical protein
MVKLKSSMRQLSKLKKGFDMTHFDKLQKAGMDEAAAAYVKSFMGKETMDQYLTKVYSKARREALQSSPEQLRTRLADEIHDFYGEAQEAFMKRRTLEPVAERTIKEAEEFGMERFGRGLEKAMTPDEAGRLYRGWRFRKNIDPQRVMKSELESFEDLMRPIVEDIPGRIGPEGGIDTITGLAGKQFEHAGERAWNLLGKEIPLSPRTGPSSVREPFEQLRQRWEESPVGIKLSDAWWSAWHKSPLGDIRRSLGVRNPYERMVRFEELERRSLEANVSRLVKQVRDIVEPLDDDAREALVRVVDKAEAMSTLKKKVYVENILDDPNLFNNIVNDPAKPRLVEQIGDAWTDIQKMNDEYMDLVRRGVAEGYWKDMGIIENYLPALHRTQNFQTSFRKARRQLRQRSVDQNTAELKFFFGLDKGTAEDLVRRSNITEFNMDLEEMLIYRAVAQGKLQQYYNMLTTFREFGVPTQFLSGPMRGQARRAGAELQYGGVRQVDHEALKGLLFPEEIARVFNRAAAATENPNWLRRAFGGFTSWWKGIVTMTTGFHIRNFMSNNVTGFLKHGPKWFNMKKNNFPAFVATTYILYRDKVGGLLKEIGMDEGLWRRALKHKVDGVHTLQEVAEDAFQRGVISHHTRAFSPEMTMTAYQARATANPMSQEFVGRQASRALGDVVENVPRFQSYLMDMMDISKGGKFTRESADWASKEAKKWFIDYQDLTEFERGFMRQVIPFYSWLRKNLANQISGIVLYPELYSILPKLEDAFTAEDAGYDPDSIPDYMKQLQMFPVRKQDGGWLMFNPNIPIQDINDIPIVFEETDRGMRPKFLSMSDIKSDILANAHPLVKTIVQAIPDKGWHLFYRRNMDYDADAPAPFKFFVKRPEMLQWLDGLAKDIGIEKGLGVYLDVDNKVKMNAKIVTVLEDVMPLIRHMDRAILLGNTMIPGFEEAVEQATGLYDKYDDEAGAIERFFQVLSFYAGIKFKVFDPEEEARQRGYRIYNRAREARRLAKRRGTPQAEREEEFLKGRERTLDYYDLL